MRAEVVKQATEEMLRSFGQSVAQKALQAERIIGLTLAIRN